MNAYFNAINGFTPFTTPLGAVSGGGGGGGGGGGLGGLGGGGWAAVAAAGAAVSEAVAWAGGGSFDAGMNGVIGPAGTRR